MNKQNILSSSKMIVLPFQILLFLTLISCGGGGSNPQGSSSSSSSSGGPTGAGAFTADLVYPLDQSTNVELNLNTIFVRFSHSITGSNLSANNFQISPNVIGTLSALSDNQFMFEPSVNLSPNTDYTITISGVTSAIDSTALPAQTWTFTTGTTIITNTTYFLSPSGSDTNNGTSALSPWQSFEHAFSQMNGGDTLRLLDGIYNSEVGTGGIHWNTSNTSLGRTFPFSAQPPSGLGRQNPTIITALNPGSVVIEVPLFLGRSNRKDSFITIEGITFDGEPNPLDSNVGYEGGQLYNTSYVKIKNSGFHGHFAIGTNDHNEGTNYNLIEDVWIWGYNARGLALNYRSSYNIWRRVSLRHDGCDIAGCGEGEGGSGFAVYDSNNISVQNLMVIDRVLSHPGDGYADISTAQHTSQSILPDEVNAEIYYLGLNEWLGSMSINSMDTAVSLEADVLIANENAATMKNLLVLKPQGRVFSLGRWSYSNENANNIYQNLTLIGHDSSTDSGGMYINGEDPTKTHQLSNILMYDYFQEPFTVPTDNGSSIGNTNIFTSKAGASNSYPSQYFNCTTNCTVSDPTAGTPSLLYPIRIETGSALSGSGESGLDIGANIVNSYGEDGTFFGDTNYNTLTNTALWPWPNEDRIKTETCQTIISKRQAAEHIARGYCDTGNRLDGANPVTITSYIWEALGNAIPTNIYNP